MIYSLLKRLKIGIVGDDSLANMRTQDKYTSQENKFFPQPLTLSKKKETNYNPM